MATIRIYVLFVTSKKDKQTVCHNCNYQIIKLNKKQKQSQCKKILQTFVKKIYTRALAWIMGNVTLFIGIFYIFSPELLIVRWTSDSRSPSNERSFYGRRTIDLRTADNYLFGKNRLTSTEHPATSIRCRHQDDEFL